ncbi:MAG: hypothetical protein M5U05_12620 [Anaerolineales bacterium]|nr:hypothetical protein [Anaerolineales bacterium]
MIATTCAWGITCGPLRGGQVALARVQLQHRQSAHAPAQRFDKGEVTDQRDLLPRPQAGDHFLGIVLAILLGQRRQQGVDRRHADRDFERAVGQRQLRQLTPAQLRQRAGAWNVRSRGVIVRRVQRGRQPAAHAAAGVEDDCGPAQPNPHIERFAVRQRLKDLANQFHAEDLLRPRALTARGRVEISLPADAPGRL